MSKKQQERNAMEVFLYVALVVLVIGSIFYAAKKHFDLWKLIFHYPREARDQMKWAWQRVFRGWDDRAAWSYNGWFLRYTPEILEEMKKNLHGYPGNFVDTFGQDGAFEAWKQVLTDMIEGFELARKVDEDMLIYKEDVSEEILKNFEEGEVVSRASVNKAFEYLSKHIHNLWD
jgi:hypothetical protein